MYVQHNRGRGYERECCGHGNNNEKRGQMNQKQFGVDEVAIVVVVQIIQMLNTIFIVKLA